METHQESASSSLSTQVYLLSAEGTNTLEAHSCVNSEKQSRDVLNTENQTSRRACSYISEQNIYTNSETVANQSYSDPSLDKNAIDSNTSVPLPHEQEFGPLETLCAKEEAMEGSAEAHLLSDNRTYGLAGTKLKNALRLILIFSWLTYGAAGIKMCNYTIEDVFELPLIFKNEDLLSTLCRVDEIVAKANKTTCPGNFSVYFNNKSSITYSYPENVFRRLYIEYGQNHKPAHKELDLSNTVCEEMPDIKLDTDRPTIEPVTTITVSPGSSDNVTTVAVSPGSSYNGAIVGIVVSLLIAFVGSISVFLYRNNSIRARILQCAGIQGPEPRSPLQLSQFKSTENGPREALDHGTAEKAESVEVNERLLGTEPNGNCTVHMVKEDNLTPNGHALPPPSPRDEVTHLD